MDNRVKWEGYFAAQNAVFALPMRVREQVDRMWLSEFEELRLLMCDQVRRDGRDTA